MTGPDVEFLDPDDTDGPAAEEDLDARPRHRWPLLLAGVALVVALVAAVLVSQDRTQPRAAPTSVRTGSAVDSGPVLPDYASLPSTAPTRSSEVDPNCPRPTSCLLRPASARVVGQVRLALRPLIGTARTLAVTDLVRPGGAVSARTVTATGPTGVRVLAVVSGSDRSPDLSGFRASVAFGRAFSGDYYVNVAVSPSGTGPAALARVDRFAADPRLVP